VRPESLIGPSAAVEIRNAERAEQGRRIGPGENSVTGIDKGLRGTGGSRQKSQQEDQLSRLHVGRLLKDVLSKNENRENVHRRP
jgi:hypothetical protein